MDKRAAAFAHYNDAAVLQMLIAGAAPDRQGGRRPDGRRSTQLTVLSTDGAGALPKQVTDNVVQTLSMLKTTTGIDLQDMIRRGVSNFSREDEEPPPAAPAAAKAVAKKASTPPPGRGRVLSSFTGYAGET